MSAEEGGAAGAVVQHPLLAILAAAATSTTASLHNDSKSHHHACAGGGADDDAGDKKSHWNKKKRKYVDDEEEPRGGDGLEEEEEEDADHGCRTLDAAAGITHDDIFSPDEKPAALVVQQRKKHYSLIDYDHDDDENNRGIGNNNHNNNDDAQRGAILHNHHQRFLVKAAADGSGKKPSASAARTGCVSPVKKRLVEDLCVKAFREGGPEGLARLMPGSIWNDPRYHAVASSRGAYSYDAFGVLLRRTKASFFKERGIKPPKVKHQQGGGAGNKKAKVRSKSQGGLRGPTAATDSSGNSRSIPEEKKKLIEGACLRELERAGVDGLRRMTASVVWKEHYDALYTDEKWGFPAFTACYNRTRAAVIKRHQPMAVADASGTNAAAAAAPPSAAVPAVRKSSDGATLPCTNPVPAAAIGSQRRQLPAAYASGGSSSGTRATAFVDGEARKMLRDMQKQVDDLSETVSHQVVVQDAMKLTQQELEQAVQQLLSLKQHQPSGAGDDDDSATVAETASTASSSSAASLSVVPSSFPSGFGEVVAACSDEENSGSEGVVGATNAAKYCIFCGDSLPVVAAFCCSCGKQQSSNKCTE